MSSQFQREQLKQLIEHNIDEEIVNLELPDIEDEMEELENELPKENLGNVKRLSLPTDDTVVSYEADGKTPLSYFKDDVWLFRLKGETVPIKFGLNHSIIGVDFTDQNTARLRQFQKLLSFFTIPGINPYSYSISPFTLQIDHNGFLRLLAFLYKHGYLLGDTKDCKSLKTIDVDALRIEVRARLKRDEGYAQVVQFSRAISRWAYITQLAALHPDMEAPFTEKEFWGSGLSKDVATYKIQKEDPYKAIDFDDLQTMIRRSIFYIKTFSEDLLFLARKFEEAHKLKIEAGLTETFANIRRSGVTKDLWTEVVNYQFATDTDTGKPWYHISFVTAEPGKGTEYIAKRSFIDELHHLRDACIFILMLLTAMRARELKDLKTNALYLDDEQIDLSHNVIELVNKGHRFDLQRTVFKTSNDLKGDDKVLPISKTGVLAFAVLVELFRSTRYRTNNEYLLPGGGLDLHGGIRIMSRQYQVDSDPVTSGTIRDWIGGFCDFLHVARYSPVRCRKTLATLLINHDPSCLELIKDLLCHKSVSMTIKYIMTLPGLAKDIKAYLVKAQRDKIIAWLVDAADGKLAGQAGDRSLDTVAKNPEAFNGEMLAVTINTLLDALIQNSNFVIIRTQAAWCLRFPSRVPFTAPCLPSKSPVDPGYELVPNPEKCVPWKCQHAGHTTKDIERINNNLKWSKRSLSEAKNKFTRSFYQEQTSYWEKVLNQLEHGRRDIVRLSIVEKTINYMG